MKLGHLIAVVLLSLTPGTAAMAQDGPLHIEITEGVAEPLAIAIPPFVDEGGAADLVGPIRDLVARDLTGTGLFRDLPQQAMLARPGGFDEPVAWSEWRATDTQALLTGAVSVVDGQISVKFRLFDIYAGRPLGDGMRFDAAPDGQRRLAHKLADQVYTRLTGETAYFDSRIAFVAETGPRTRRVKRLALMDYDGGGQRYLTDGAELVLTPRFSPDGKRLAYVTFAGGTPRIALFDLDSMSVQQPPAEPGTMSFGPRFSPDGRWLVYSQERGGNTDIWQMDVATGLRRPLVEGPGIDTAPSISPDGKRLAFESDRSGSKQIYVMPMAGGEAERISFGKGKYGTPVWSPQGDLIAFTLQKGDSFHIGAMRPDGSGERALTSSPHDEGPSWAPNGRVVVFTRQEPGGKGVSRLHSVDITGRNMRPVEMKAAASDPSWGPLLP